VDSFDLGHFYVWWPGNSSIFGTKWFFNFINDYNLSHEFSSRKKHLKLLLFDTINTIRKVNNCLHVNNGREYVNHDMTKFLSKQGTVHEFTCVITQQQNDITKRENKLLLEVTKALLFQMSIPKPYWGETILAVAYLIN